MILIGDKNIEYENIERVVCCDDIKTTSSNTTVLFDFDINILQYTKQNDISSAVVIKNITEMIYSANLGAKYIVTPQEIIVKTQKIADNYMYDSRILAIIENSDEIEKIAHQEIDGVIYKELL